MYFFPIWFVAEPPAETVPSTNSISTRSGSHLFFVTSLSINNTHDADIYIDVDDVVVSWMRSIRDSRVKFVKTHLKNILVKGRNIGTKIMKLAAKATRKLERFLVMFSCQWIGATGICNPLTASFSYVEKWKKHLKALLTMVFERLQWVWLKFSQLLVSCVQTFQMWVDLTFFVTVVKNRFGPEAYRCYIPPMCEQNFEVVEVINDFSFFTRLESFNKSPVFLHKWNLGRTVGNLVKNEK